MDDRLKAAPLSQDEVAADDWLVAALDIARREAQLAPLVHAIDALTKALSSPMRVAVVGLIKAGKSTLINALLRETILPVGIVETTYTVATLTWNATPTLRLHFKDGRPIEPHPFADLDRFVRRGADIELLRSISQVEIGYPSAVLQQMTLIDTPGLGSTHVHDSENTREALNLSRAAHAATEHEARIADAVLYVFSRGLHESDQAVLTALQGAAFGRVSPLNAIAALSKVDLYWPSDDPLASGARIAGRLCQDRGVRRTLYDILPVAGLAAGGGLPLEQEDLASLQLLAALPHAALDSLLSSDRRFAQRDDPAIPVPPAARERLLDRLGSWGVWSACAALRADPAVHLASELRRSSGLDALSDRILRHFGNRSRLIKLNSALPALHATIFSLRQRLELHSAARRLLDEIGSMLEKVERTDLAFAQLAVLQDHYAGRLEFNTEEVESLKAVTGENGPSIAARLGIPPDLNPEELECRLRAQIGRWNAIASGADLRTSATQAAARIIARSYEAIAVQRGSGTGAK